MHRWSATKNVPWLFFNNDKLWTSHNCGEVHMLFIVNLEHTYAIIKKKRQQKMTTEEVTRKVWNRSQRISWYETINFILVSIIRRTSFRKPRRHVKPFSRIVMLLLSLFLMIFLLTNSFSMIFQIKQLWGHEVNVNSHHKTWEHKNIPWLWPENKPLEKHFRSDIHAAHLDHLRTTDWTREKVRNDYFGVFELLL